MDMFKEQIERELNLDSSRDNFLEESEFKFIEDQKERKKIFLQN